MSDKILYYYRPGEEHKGQSIPAVPNKDLTEAEFYALRRWQQSAVVAAPFFVLAKSKAAGGAKKRKADPPTAPDPVKK